MQALDMSGVAGQGEILLAAADLQDLGVDRTHALERCGAHTDLAQRRITGGGNHRGERQHHAKTQGQFLRRTQAGDMPLQISPHISHSTPATGEPGSPAELAR
ncbi:hypothetical protein D3C80_1629920 [compost metagenome]